MIKKILCGIALVAGLVSCNEDYDNWDSPQTNTENEAVQKLVMEVTPSVDFIDFANLANDNIQLFTTNLSEGTVDDFVVTFSGAGDKEKAITATSEGMIAADDLKSVITSFFGNAPEEHTMTATVSAVVAIATADGMVKAKKVGEPFTLKTKLTAPFIDEGYWLVGDFASWDATGALAFTHIGSGSVYDAPTFTITFTTTADNQYWKIIPQNNYAGDFWKEGETGVVGTQVDGDASMSGSLTTNSPQAGKIEKAGMYQMTIDMMNYTYTIQELAFKQFVYFIGATDGWGASDQKLKSSDFDGKYTGFIYIADPNGWGLEFKFQRTAGSWDDEINSGTFAAGITGDFEDGGGNIRATAGEGIYYITLDLAAGTLNGTKINNMNLVGDFNGWNAADDAQQMTWDAENYCYVITGAGVTATGWKFTANNDWGINLGGDVNALTQDGQNIEQAGTTIKLYPTRKTSDNIYCTIE